MAERILRGEELAEATVERAKTDFTRFREMGEPAVLTTVIIGDDPTSHKYIEMKKRQGESMGVEMINLAIDAQAKQSEVDERIAELNENTHAILIQYPLPEGLSYTQIMDSVDPHKDVDGLHPYNLGMLIHDPVDYRGIIPCTPNGVIQLLEHGGVDLDQPDVTVVGNGMTIGGPISKLLAMRNGPGIGATVTSVHKGTRDIAKHTSQSDIVIGAAGSPGIITGDMVQEGATLVSVGVRYNEQGKARGDFDESAKEKAGVFVPVTGGIGPMTRANLWANVVRCYELGEGVKATK